MMFSNIILLTSTTFTALMAGLFYSYSCSVMLGLKLLPDGQFIQSMQTINRAIQNPVFFLVFFGTLILLPANAYLHYSQATTKQFWLFLTATILYIVGVFGVTAFGNIPLNNSLDNFNLTNASKEAVQLCRVGFEGPWNRLNIIRTISSILSIVLMIVGCINSGKEILISKGH